MTRRHFQAIAKALYGTRPDPKYYGHVAYRQQWELDVKELTKVLAAMNPRFNEDRFVAACTYGCDGPPIGP